MICEVAKLKKVFVEKSNLFEISSLDTFLLFCTFFIMETGTLSKKSEVMAAYPLFRHTWLAPQGLACAGLAFGREDVQGPSLSPLRAPSMQGYRRAPFWAPGTPRGAGPLSPGAWGLSKRPTHEQVTGAQRRAMVFAWKKETEAGWGG